MLGRAFSLAPFSGLARAAPPACLCSLANARQPLKTTPPTLRGRRGVKWSRSSVPGVPLRLRRPVPGFRACQPHKRRNRAAGRLRQTASAENGPRQNMERGESSGGVGEPFSADAKEQEHPGTSRPPVVDLSVVERRPRGVEPRMRALYIKGHASSRILPYGGIEARRRPSPLHRATSPVACVAFCDTGWRWGEAVRSASPRL